MQSLGKYMVNGTNGMVVTVDPEHHDLKNIACNKSCIARLVVQKHILVVTTVGSEQQLVESGFLEKHLPFVTGLLFFP